MKLCISPIHLGRYKIEVLDENNQVTAGFDGGSALVMVMLTRFIFEPESRQYTQDQKRSSDALANETLSRFLEDPVLSPNAGARAYIESCKVDEVQPPDQRPRGERKDLNP